MNLELSDKSENLRMCAVLAERFERCTSPHGISFSFNFSSVPVLKLGLDRELVGELTIIDLFFVIKINEKNFN